MAGGCCSLAGPGGTQATSAAAPAWQPPSGEKRRSVLETESGIAVGGTCV